jgi:hypothetical protein
MDVGSFRKSFISFILIKSDTVNRNVSLVTHGRVDTAYYSRSEVD